MKINHNSQFINNLLFTRTQLHLIIALVNIKKQCFT
nr:MAG TPA: hypothetical protein [Caudoviricetes sp.]